MVSRIAVGIVDSASGCVRSLEWCGAVEDWEWNVVGVASSPGAQVLGDLEGVGVVVAGGECDPVGTHDCFDEVEASGMVVADREMRLVHLVTFCWGCPTPQVRDLRGGAWL